MEETEPLSLAVIKSIAAVEGADPTELDLTLQNHIDPELIDQLGADGPAKWLLEFVVDSYAVEVNHRGEVTVDDRETFSGVD